MWFYQVRLAVKFQKQWKKYPKKAIEILIAFFMFLQLIYFSGKIFKYIRTSNQLLNLREILTFKVLIFY